MEEEKKSKDPGVDIIANYYSNFQQSELENVEKKVRKARNALFVVGALSLVANLILLGLDDQLSGFPLVFALMISAVFIGLGFLTKKQPFTSIIIGLAIYVGLWILDMIVGGSEYITKGLFLRIAIIYFLV